MSILKTNENEKIININPVFLYQDYVTKFLIPSYSPYIIATAEFIVIFIILYYFFYTELIFLYNLYLNRYIKTPNQIDTENNLLEKINKIFKSKLICKNNEIWIKKEDGSDIPGQTLNKQTIKLKDNSECEDFINSNF